MEGNQPPPSSQTVRRSVARRIHISCYETGYRFTSSSSTTVANHLRSGARQQTYSVVYEHHTHLGVSTSANAQLEASEEVSLRGGDLSGSSALSADAAIETVESNDGLHSELFDDEDDELTFFPDTTSAKSNTVVYEESLSAESQTQKKEATTQCSLITDGDKENQNCNAEQTPEPDSPEPKRRKQAKKKMPAMHHSTFCGLPPSPPPEDTLAKIGPASTSRDDLTSILNRPPSTSNALANPHLKRKSEFTVHVRHGKVPLSQQHLNSRRNARPSPGSDYYRDSRLGLIKYIPKIPRLAELGGAVGHDCVVLKAVDNHVLVLTLTSEREGKHHSPHVFFVCQQQCCLGMIQGREGCENVPKRALHFNEAARPGCNLTYLYQIDQVARMRHEYGAYHKHQGRHQQMFQGHWVPEDCLRHAYFHLTTPGLPCRLAKESLELVQQRTVNFNSLPHQ